MRFPRYKRAGFARALQLCFASLFFLCVYSPNLHAAISTIKSVEDAYVQNGANAGRNFGSATELHIGTSSTAANNYDSYLRFNAGTVNGVVNSAKLRIYARLSSAGTVATTAYAVSNTTWAYNTITWNNKPARGASLGSVTVSSTTYSFREIDVTSYVRAEFAAGRKVLNFAYHSVSNSTPYITAPSINATSNQPELVIDAGAVSPPPGNSLTLTPTADAYVVGGSSTNFGANAELRVRTSATTSSNYDTYLKFDASLAASVVSSAKLRIYARLSAAGTISTTVYAVANTAWGERTITGINRPARGASLASAVVASTSYAFIEVDVTNYVQSEFAAGRRVLSFTYHNGANTSPYITAHSKEGVNRPQLIITTPNTPPPNAAPTVSLTSPPSGATFNAPANISLSANAADSDGSIIKVEYFNGANLIATGAATAPYAATWANVPAGSYSITAKATDNGGAATTSPAVSVSVIADTQGPAISLQTPADQAVLPADAIPIIGAAYSDTGSGINLATAKLTVDGVDITANAVTTPTGISYTPAAALAEGTHNAQLTIADSSGNIAQASWAFTTRTAPQIKDISPADLQNIADPLTPISASLSDAGAGVDPSRSVLRIDGVVAGSAQSGATNLSFTPTASWSTGTHVVNLTVYDLAGNSATVAWSFIYDPAPLIYDETPRDVFVAVPNPLIRVLLRDLGNGINLTATTIQLDGADVTAQAIITATEIRFTPTALTDGVHTVTVNTQSNTGKIATKQWQFTRLIPPAPPAPEEGVRTPPVFNTTIQIIP